MRLIHVSRRKPTAPLTSGRARASRFTPSAAPFGLLALLCGTTGCEAIPKVSVTPEADTVTSESGSSVALSVTLAKKPATRIEVYAVSSDDSEGVVSAPLFFDAQSWNVAQEIRVTGVDDNLNDGDQSYQVTVYARSVSAPAAQAQIVSTLSFVNRDDDLVQFDGIGDLTGGDTKSQVTSLSAAGDVVVGYSGADTGDEAVRWTPTAHLVGLGGPSSRAESVSPDGSLISGSVAEASYDTGRAAVLWRGDAAFTFVSTKPDPQTSNPLFWFVDGQVVRNDGRVYGTCVQVASFDVPIACFAEGAEAPVNLPASFVYAADASDNYAGSERVDRHAPPGAAAIYDGTPLSFPADVLCDPPTGCTADARDFSADGNVIVGTSAIPPGPPPAQSPLVQTAFVYTPTEHFVRLPDLAGGDAASGAYAVSADGQIIAGFGSDERGQQAVVWIDRSPKAVEDLVLELGGELPSGWTLLDVRAISADGHVLAGNGTNPEGNPEGYRLVLPSAL